MPVLISNDSNQDSRAEAEEAGPTKTPMVPTHSRLWYNYDKMLSFHHFISTSSETTSNIFFKMNEHVYFEKGNGQELV